MEIHLTAQTYFTDVQVVSPTAPMFTTHATKRGGAAKFREKQKTNKYSHLANAHGANFLPFIIETYGLLGSKAILLINKILDNCDDIPASPNPHFSSFKSYMLAALSFALQKGNNLVSTTCARTARVKLQQLSRHQQ
jgi:hypothetical protein